MGPSMNVTTRQGASRSLGTRRAIASRVSQAPVKRSNAR